MAPAEHREVRQRRRAALCPVAEVVPLADTDAAAGKAAATVPMVQRPPERRRNRPRAGPDLHDPAVRGVTHDDAARVARQALGRFRGNARAVLEDGLARLIGVRQDGGVDVDDDLVPLAGGAGVDLVMQRRFGEQRQGVGLLLVHGRSVVPRRGLAVDGRAGGVQRAQEQGAGLGRQAPPHDDGPVLVLVDVQRARRVLVSRVMGLCLPVHPTPAADDALDVLGGARARHREQALFGLGRGDARHRPHLGVRDLAARERLGQARQGGERARDAHALARGDDRIRRRRGGQRSITDRRRRRDRTAILVVQRFRQRRVEAQTACATAL